MSKRSQVQDFLEHSQIDRKLSDKVLKAISKGGMVTAEAVMKIAEDAGYSFSREEFEREVRASIVARYKAGEFGLASTVNANDPPESSCAKGCLSYTTSWHPDPSIGGPAINPAPFRTRR